MIKLLRKLFARRPQKHYAHDWDGTHATCVCGYHSVWDYDLSNHFYAHEQMMREIKPTKAEVRVGVDGDTIILMEVTDEHLKLIYQGSIQDFSIQEEDK